MEMTKSRPVGSRIQRPRRKLAEARRYAFTRLSEGRTEAIDALVEYARVRALGLLRGSMPSGLRSARTLGDRLKGWAIDKVAKFIAAKIERDTWKVVLERQKLSFDRFVEAMQDGDPLTRLARH